MRTKAPPKAVVPADYPELALLAWNRDPACPIAAEEAFALYERNWRHVDAGGLTPQEAALVRELTDLFGHGHWLAA
jgi:hypothetical protein